MSRMHTSRSTPFRREGSSVSQASTNLWRICCPLRRASLWQSTAQQRGWFRVVELQRAGANTMPGDVSSSLQKIGSSLDAFVEVNR